MLNIISIRVLMLSHSIVSDSLRPHVLYVAHQALLSLGFSRQEYWGGQPFPFLGIFNTNQSHNEIPLLTYQDDCNQKDR